MNKRTLMQKSALWQLLFFSFILAGLTGALYRVGMLMALPDLLSLQNVRHAHSHLMFFGWAAPLPLYIIWRIIGFEEVPKNRNYHIMEWGLWGMLGFGLLSFPFFLLFGYRPVPFGSSSLPLSVICSGMVMICWYLFMGGYLSIRKKIPEEKRNSWFEAALVMLFVCSLGAWGVAVVQFLGITNPLMGKALTHFFLACFTEGWVVLAIVALLDEALGIGIGEYMLSPTILMSGVLLGAPLTFPYGISETLLTPLMLNTARFGGFVAGAGLSIIGYSILRSGKVSRSIWIWPVGLLLLKSILQILASVMPSALWLSDHALRIFYLHVLLLGAFTLTGVAFFHKFRGLSYRSYTGVAISVAIVLVSLLLLTRFWPVAWGGMWIYNLVTGAALLPVIAVIFEWFKLRT